MVMSGLRLFWSVLGLSLVFGIATSGDTAQAAVALHCRNTTSGATWDIPVDLVNSTVDSVPARITDNSISWEDQTFHFYDFHRRTGALDMHVASSTGGIYLLDRCVLN
jgi:hypothetical protein